MRPKSDSPSSRAARLRVLIADTAPGTDLPPEALAELLALARLGGAEYAAGRVTPTGFGRSGVALVRRDGRADGERCLVGPLVILNCPPGHQQAALGGFGDRTVAVPQAELYAEEWARLALALRRLDPGRQGVTAGRLKAKAGIGRAAFDRALAELVERGLAKAVQIKASGRMVAGARLLAAAAVG
jgi:hypothetical protein